MSARNEKRYHVTVLFGAGHDEWFDASDAALAYADIEIEKLLSEYPDLATEAFDGIFCEQQDTHQTWRYECVKGISMWIPDGEDTINRYQESENASNIAAANRPLF